MAEECSINPIGESGRRDLDQQGADAHTDFASGGTLGRMSVTSLQLSQRIAGIVVSKDRNGNDREMEITRVVCPNISDGDRAFAQTLFRRFRRWRRPVGILLV